MSILFTHGYFLCEDPKEQEIMKPYVPLGILYISAYLEKNGISNEVFDSTFSSFDELKSKLIAERPEILAIYTNLMTKLNVLKIIRLVKNELKLIDTKIILGGPEVRHHLKNFLEYGADMIVIGEGEETMLEICNYYKEHKTLPVNCNGTAFIETTTNSVKINPERNLIKSMDEICVPARNKIDLRKYLNAWKSKHGYSMLSVSTMRGCPYTCKWCSRAVYGGTYRRRKPALVAEELLQIKNEYQPDRIWFVDDVFTISHKWLEEFAKEVKSKNAIIPFEIITRADRLNEAVIKTLKDCGCFRIWIGAESGSQKIIDAMDRRVEAGQVREMIKLTRKNGMEAGTFIMLGYPGEEKNDIKETIEHLIDANPDQYTITIAYPIKGTQLYSEVESQITTVNEWENSTDRDIDFKRARSHKFYEYGVRWVYNAVNAEREKNFFKRTKLRLKAVASQIMMGVS
ncbi:MAG: B12-binding domain-containing radical SAM protein [Bacteroidia bacterium]|nr:B12-binding domain-containing radical SAM protein [Bacteroidia bacterium]